MFDKWLFRIGAIGGAIGGICGFLYWAEIKPKDLRAGLTAFTVPHSAGLIVGLLLFALSIGLSFYSIYREKRAAKKQQEAIAKVKRDYEEHAAALVRQGEERVKAAINAEKLVESGPRPLVIHSAVYGTGPDTDMDVREKLQGMAGSGLVVAVENSLVPQDPRIGVKKRLLVEYSYGNPHRISVNRPEGCRLVLPEDTWVRDQLSKFQYTNLKDSDPKILLKFCDDRGFAVDKDNEAYFALENHGGSDAMCVCLDSLSFEKDVVQYKTGPRMNIAPQRSKFFYLDFVTLDNRTSDLKDIFALIGKAWMLLGDPTIPGLSVPVRATYQDEMRNLFATECDLVFDPSAHFKVRAGGKGVVVLSTQNHRFRKLAVAVES